MPKVLDTRTRTPVPPMLVCTTWRRVTLVKEGGAAGARPPKPSWVTGLTAQVPTHFWLAVCARAPVALARVSAVMAHRRTMDPRENWVAEGDGD